MGVSSNNTTVGYFNPQVVSAQDYYPFGMLQPGRVFNASGYRYGFNGQEMNNEVNGLGDSYKAQFWEYDSRIGRRWNLDPKPITGISSYSAFNNKPISLSDHLGDSAIKPAPLMPRHPINGPADYGYVPYNIIGFLVNGGQSLLNKGGQYLNAASKPDPVAGLSGQIGNDIRSVGAFISGENNYFPNTPNEQILQDAKAFYTNPDNYFQAFENTVAIMAPAAGFTKIN